MLDVWHECFYHGELPARTCAILVAGNGTRVGQRDENENAYTEE